MNKKIKIGSKPMGSSHHKLIDEWVSGKKTPHLDLSNKEKEIRFTVVLAESLYSELKIKAAKERKKLKEIITDTFTKALKQ